MGENVPKAWSNLVNYGYGHLQRDDFKHAVVNHLSGECETNKKPKPIVQPDVVFPPAVERGPDAGREDGNHEQAEGQGDEPESGTGSRAHSR